VVGHRHQSRFRFYHMLNVRTVDPDVAGTQPIRRPARDDSNITTGPRDRFTRHKSSSHSPHPRVLAR
jgi:hypothetical protein